jgi:ABC-type transport system substrate-binding protein
VVVVPDSGRDQIGLKGLLFMRKRPHPVPAPIRAAIAAAIDRAAIASAPTAQELVPGDRLLPAEMLGYQPSLSVHPFDPAAARAAVAAAGGWGEEPLLIGAFDSDAGEAAALATALQGLGIPVRVVPFSQTALEANMREPTVDAVIVEVYGTAWGSDPYPHLSELTSAIQEVSWLNPEIEAEVANAAQTADRVAREKHYANIERALLEEAAFVPLGQLKLGPTGGLALRTEVRGLVDPTGERAWRNRAVPPFAQVWLTPP